MSTTEQTVCYELNKTISPNYNECICHSISIYNSIIFWNTKGHCTNCSKNTDLKSIVTNNYILSMCKDCWLSLSDQIKTHFDNNP